MGYLGKSMLELVPNVEKPMPQVPFGVGWNPTHADHTGHDLGMVSGLGFATLMYQLSKFGVGTCLTMRNV